MHAIIITLSHRSHRRCFPQTRGRYVLGTDHIPQRQDPILRDLTHETRALPVDQHTYRDNLGSPRVHRTLAPHSPVRPLPLLKTQANRRAVEIMIPATRFGTPLRPVILYVISHSPHSRSNASHRRGTSYSRLQLSPQPTRPQSRFSTPPRSSLAPVSCPCPRANSSSLYTPNYPSIKLAQLLRRKPTSAYRSSSACGPQNHSPPLWCGRCMSRHARDCAVGGRTVGGSGGGRWEVYVCWC